MTTQTIDVIDVLTGEADALAKLRDRRPVTREQLQASFDALFRPVSDTTVSLAERALVAAFATRLTADDETATFYAARARRADDTLARLVLSEAATAATSGPFGLYREDGLTSESTDGDRYAPDPAVVDALGARLAAALTHTHLLTYRPREADDAAITALLQAGWDEDGIVTLSQLVSFLAFQQRVATGLRVLASAPATTEEVSA